MDPSCRGLVLPRPPWNSRFPGRLNLGMKCSGACNVFPWLAGGVGNVHIWCSDGPAPEVVAATGGTPPPADTGSIQNVLPAPLVGAGATAHMAVAGSMLEGRSNPEDPAASCCCFGNCSPPPPLLKLLLLFEGDPPPP
ncbi:hypothetical protein TorRG33x02_202130 [Trema orientale]|uniref:Uncharacterized protein n=1 Tax=Trema orientale TaxID=63057 RepID=A0A2P5EEE5_TREOI|nr:hypothetical protein TorRG33x02_202130 [Trema orientale]